MSTQPPETTDGPVTGNGELSPRERLTQSRQRISVWLEENDPPMPTQHEGTHPLTAILRDVLGEWWRRHPLFASLNITGETARNAIVPLIRRHPIAVLGVAAVAGAVMVRSSAWRWVVRPAVVAGLASQIVGRVIAQMPTTPSDSPPHPRRATPRTRPLAPPTGRVR